MKSKLWLLSAAGASVCLLSFLVGTVLAYESPGTGGMTMLSTGVIEWVSGADEYAVADTKVGRYIGGAAYVSSNGVAGEGAVRVANIIASPSNGLTLAQRYEVGELFNTWAGFFGIQAITNDEFDIVGYSPTTTGNAGAAYLNGGWATDGHGGNTGVFGGAAGGSNKDGGDVGFGGGFGTGVGNGGEVWAKPGGSASGTPGAFILYDVSDGVRFRMLGLGTEIAIVNSTSFSGSGTATEEGFRQRVYTHTGGVGNPTALTASVSRGLFTNTGTTTQVYENLPTLDGAEDVGLEYELYCDDTDGIRFVAASGDTITVGAFTSASGGYVGSVAVGCRFKVTAVSTSQWVANAPTSDWFGN